MVPQQDRAESQQGLEGWTEEIWLLQGSPHREAHGKWEDMGFRTQRALSAEGKGKSLEAGTPTGQ